MIVVVDGGNGSVTMAEPENLRGLSVELRSCSPAEAGLLLGELGWLDGEHVWLDIDGLRALSPLTGDPEWVTGFDGMIAYAGTKGWLNEAGSLVRAHLS